MIGPESLKEARWAFFKVVKLARRFFMRYKREIKVRVQDGNIVTFNAEERNKLLLAYPCPQCKSKRRTDLISTLFEHKNPGFFRWQCNKCNEWISTTKTLKYVRDKVNELTREGSIIVNKLRQIYPDHPFFK